VLQADAHRDASTRRQREREARLLAWQERFDAVDRVAATLKAYGLTGGSEQADLLTHTMQRWKQLKRAR
jgi:hypothetical protein